MDLRTLFNSLPAPRGGDSRSLSAVQIAGFPAVRLGRTMAGEPALIVAATKDGSIVEAPVQLAHLAVEHGVYCRIEGEDGAIDGRFCVVRLIDADQDLALYFLDILPAVVRSVGASPTSKSVGEALAGVVELFRELGEPPRTSVQGLWAELFVVSEAEDPARMMHAWHAVPEERFDFSSGPQRIEIKSTAGRRRIHHFSLEQLRGPSEVTVLVGSVLMEHSVGGLTLGAVVQRVRDALDDRPDLLARLDRVVAASLGTDLPQALHASFDEQLASQSLGWFWATAIPSVEPPLPANVSNVSFLAALDATPQVAKSELSRDLGLFGAV